MDESSVAFHTPEMKSQSKQWLPKGSPAPLKGKDQASRKKQMVFAFFDDSGSVYEHFASVGAKINSDYIIEVLRKFMKVFHRKRPEMAAGEWFLHWDNTPVHTSASVRGFLAARGIKTLLHPPYSPDLAPADFFLFPCIKRALAGTTIRSQSVQRAWEREVKLVSTEDFRRAFQRWLERHEKCIRLDGGYVEKM